MKLPLDALSRWLLPLALAGWLAGALALLGALAAWREADVTAPAQPIAFPHTVHAGTLSLPCVFCHLNVERSAQATVPPLSVCMTCHETIAAGRPEVEKLKAHVARGEPVTWRRVHELPSFVRFTHKRHVRGGVACATCHGDVAAMARITRVRPLTMGWCVTCHRTRGAPTDCATCHV